jgi:hypothetical protein
MVAQIMRLTTVAFALLIIVASASAQKAAVVNKNMKQTRVTKMTKAAVKTPPPVKKTTNVTKVVTAVVTPPQPPKAEGVAIGPQTSSFKLIGSKEVPGGWQYTLHARWWAVYDNDAVPASIHDVDENTETARDLLVTKVTPIEGALEDGWKVIELFLPANKNLPATWRLVLGPNLNALRTNRSQLPGMSILRQ